MMMMIGRPAVMTWRPVMVMIVMMMRMAMMRRMRMAVVWWRTPMFRWRQSAVIGSEESQMSFRVAGRQYKSNYSFI